MSIFFSDIKNKIQRGRTAGVAGISLNVNSLFDSPAKRMAAARSGLNASSLGRGNLVKLSLDSDGAVKFIVTATGAVTDSIEEAVALNQELGLSDVKVLGQRLSSNPAYEKLLERSRKYADSYGAAEGIFKDIKNKLGSLSDAEKQILSRAGIDVDNLGTLQAQILTLTKDQQEGSAAVIERIEAAKKSGKLNGIFIPDDGGGRMLMFSQQGADGSRKALDAYQSHLLLSNVGHGYFDTNNLDEIMSKALTDPGGAYEKLVKMIEKSSKRSRAYLSPREISLEGAGLTNVLKTFAGDTNKLPLSQLSLIKDDEFEILSKFAFGKDYDFGGAFRGKALKEYYKDLSADRIVQNIIDTFEEGKLDSAALDEMKSAIKTFHISNEAKIGKKFLSDDLKKHLLESFATTDKRKIAVEGIFESLEKSVDGFDLVNKRFIDSYLSRLKEEKRIADRNIRNITRSSRSVDPSSTTDLEMLFATRNDLDDKIRRIENGDLYQITGRGRTKYGGRFYNIKNAVSAENEFKGTYLEKVAAIFSRHSLKEEIGFAGQRESIILSGIGESKGSVYADAVSLNFNPELFTDPGSINAIKAYQNEVIQDFEKVIDSGVVPDKIRKMIRQQASVSIDNLPISERAAAVRNKEFAKTIDDMLMSGISPGDSPTLMSMLHKFHATMAFKEKAYKGGTFFGAALPETHRFSLITEMGMQGVQDNPFRLPLSVSADMRLSSGAVENIADIGVFRVRGHQAILHHTGTGKYFHSLGGFDLDDKGIARVVTYEDNAGMKRLGFNIFRQPSGPEEFMFMRMMMDQDSIQGMFGHERFKRQLKDFIASGETLDSSVSNDDLLKLQEILDSTGGTSINYERKRMENVIARFSERMGNTYQLSDEAISKMSINGTATLGLKDLYEVVNGEVRAINPEYTKTGIYKALIENKAFEMDPDILDKVGKLNIDPNVKSIILNKNLSSDEMLQHLAQQATNASANKRHEVYATIGTIIDELSAKKMKAQAGNLGTYVNRSSVIGSTLNQYEDYLKSLDPTSDAFKFLTDKRNIHYRAGLIAQEEAIDASVNLSVTKRLQLATRQFIQDNIGDINQSNLSSQLSRFYDIAGRGTEVTIDDIGKQGISSLGRIIGFTRATGSHSQELEKGLGLDKFTIQAKLTSEDRKIVLESMIQGMEDSMQRSQAGAIASTRDRIAVEAELSRYKKLIESGTDEEVLKVLLKDVGLSAKSKYNTFSALNMQESALLLESKAKGAINRSMLDPYTRLAKSTMEEDALAAQLIDSHAEDIGRFYKVFGEDLKSLTDIEKSYLAIAKRNVGEKLLEKIDAAAQLQGISRSGLYNALYKTGNQVGFDPTQLMYFEGSSSIPGDVSTVARETLDGMLFNKRLNSIRYLEDANLENANNIFNILPPGAKDVKDIERLKELASPILEQLRNIPESSINNQQILNKNILDALMGESSNIGDLAQRQQAEYEANLLRLTVERNKLTDEVGDIGAEIARRGLGDTRGTIADIADTSVGSVMSRSERESLNAALGLRDEASNFFRSTKYERFSLKQFQEGGKYFDLVKSPSVRKGVAAVAGLIVGSFLYSSYKGRSQDDMQGPPLLPGGSPYEDALPSSSGSMPDLSSQGYNMGVSYNVSLYGDRNSISNFNKNAGRLTNGNINATMYNRIPDVGRDPYSSLASSY